MRCFVFICMCLVLSGFLLAGDLSVVPAEETVVAETSWVPVLKNISSLLIHILTPILLILAAWVATKLSSKLGVEMTKSQNEIITGIVKKGINWTESWANREDVNVSAQTKLQNTINYIVDEVQKTNLPEMATEKVTRLIESQLQYDKSKK